MIVGFTGTRNGMTDKQKQRIKQILSDRKVLIVHHGMCVGADDDFNTIATNLGIATVGHPPENTRLMSNCRCDTCMEPKNYVTRDHAIVDSSDILLATPKSFLEEIRSGTWMTVRYARKQNKGIIIIFPDGEIKEEPWNAPAGFDKGTLKF